MIKFNYFLFLTFSALMMTAAVSAQTNKNTVTLKGKLKNFSNQVDVEDLSDLQNLLPATADRIIIPDTAGTFQIRFSLKNPNYFRLGRNILYLSPGDEMELFVDKNNPALATFKGKGSIPNLYLRNTPFPKGGSFVEAGRRIQKNAQATIDTILKIADNRKTELAGTIGITKEFRRLEDARIKADLINSLRAGISSYRPRISADSLANYTTEYKKLVTPLLEQYSRNFTDASLMKLVVYRDIIDEVLKHPGPQKDATQIKEWRQSYSLINEMKKHSDKKILAEYASRITLIKTSEYKNALSQSLANLLKFGKGDQAIDFTAVNLDGSKVKLSSLKGKVIYVDLWATWCGPCLAEMPMYEALKEKNKGNADVVFVSLSIDDGEEVWKKNVEARKADGIQWQINRNALNDYDIVSIPRSLLIDKDFKVVDMNAPLPSSKEIQATINTLLGL